MLEGYWRALAVLAQPCLQQPSPSCTCPRSAGSPGLQQFLSHLFQLLCRPCVTVIVTRGDLQHFLDPINEVLMVLLRRLLPVCMVRLEVIGEGRDHLGHLVLPVSLRSLPDGVQVGAHGRHLS